MRKSNKDKEHRNSVKSNCEVSKSKGSKDTRKSLSKTKKVNKKGKRKHRFIRKIAKGTNQTTTIEESSDNDSRVRETSLPNKKLSNDMAMPPNQIFNLTNTKFNFV